MIFYYMFVEWDIGVKYYFEVLLMEVLWIYYEVIWWVFGVVRMVCGLFMFVVLGKVYLLGIVEVVNEKVFVL